MAIVFNGTDQAIKESAFATDFDQAFTLAVKFKGTVASGGIGIIGACNTNSTANGILYLRRRTDLGGWVLQQLGDNDANTSPVVNLANDIWHSVVIVNNGNGTANLYLNDDAVKSITYSSSNKTLEDIVLGAAVPFGDDTGVTQWFNGKCAYYRRSKTAISAANAAAYNAAASVAEINAVLPDGADLIEDATVSGSAASLTNVGTPTYDADDPLASSGPTITDIDGDESVYPGQSYVIQATDDIGATQGTVFWERLDGTDDVQHTVTNWDAATDQIMVTALRGGHNYGSGLYQARVVLGDGTTEILFDNAGSGLTLEAQPNTFAITAASPNTTEDASLWAGLVDTSTGDPVTVVDGDQAWVKTLLDGLAIDPTGDISANETGSFTVQFWRASEGVWGNDQTVSFALPEEPNPPAIGRGMKKALKLTLKKSLRADI